MSKRVGDMEALRAAAGIHTKLNEGRRDNIKKLDMEGDLLRSFSTFLKDLESIKERMERPSYPMNPHMPYGHGGREQKPEQVDKSELYKLSQLKMQMVDKALKEVFDVKEDHDEDEED